MGATGCSSAGVVVIHALAGKQLVAPEGLRSVRNFDFRMKQPSALPHTASSRYVVGIDLGTTNSAVTYIDTEKSPWRIQTFSIPQLVAPGQVESRETLPSFLYEAATDEFAAGALKCPWHKAEPGFAVGFFARDQGTMTPGRLINSAKSWLCHSGVDRTAALLPWHGASDVPKLSPVEASARYLSHLRDAWNARFPRDSLAEQEIVLTLPASFDEIARELTVKAAAAAGLPRVVLIEEPQAAFYAWIYAHADDWQERVSPKSVSFATRQVRTSTAHCRGESLPIFRSTYCAKVRSKLSPPRIK